VLVAKRTGTTQKTKALYLWRYYTNQKSNGSSIHVKQTQVREILNKMRLRVYWKKFISVWSKKNLFLLAKAYSMLKMYSNINFRNKNAGFRQIYRMLYNQTVFWMLLFLRWQAEVGYFMYPFAWFWTFFPVAISTSVNAAWVYMKGGPAGTLFRDLGPDNYGGVRDWRNIWVPVTTKLGIIYRN